MGSWEWQAATNSDAKVITIHAKLLARGDAAHLAGTAPPVLQPVGRDQEIGTGRRFPRARSSSLGCFSQPFPRGDFYSEDSLVTVIGNLPGVTWAKPAFNLVNLANLASGILKTCCQSHRGRKHSPDFG